MPIPVLTAGNDQFIHSAGRQCTRFPVFKTSHAHHSQFRVVTVQWYGCNLQWVLYITDRRICIHVRQIQIDVQLTYHCNAWIQPLLQFCAIIPQLRYWLRQAAIPNSFTLRARQKRSHVSIDHHTRPVLFVWRHWRLVWFPRNTIRVSIYPFILKKITWEKYGSLKSHQHKKLCPK